MGVNPDRRSGENPSGNSCSCAGTDSIGLSFPSDPTDNTERGILVTGHTRISISSTQACTSTGSASQCATPSCLQWSLPLRGPQGSSLSASRPPLDQQTSSASTPPHSALQPRLRMHSMRSLRPRSERSHRKKTCSYLETSKPG